MVFTIWLEVVYVYVSVVFASSSLVFVPRNMPPPSADSPILAGLYPRSSHFPEKHHFSLVIVIAVVAHHKTASQQVHPYPN
jgi:hypothetical protein